MWNEFKFQGIERFKTVKIYRISKRLWQKGQSTGRAVSQTISQKLRNACRAFF